MFLSNGLNAFACKLVKSMTTQFHPDSNSAATSFAHTEQATMIESPIQRLQGCLGNVSATLNILSHLMDLAH